MWPSQSPWLIIYHWNGERHTKRENGYLTARNPQFENFLGPRSLYTGSLSIQSVSFLSFCRASDVVFLRNGATHKVRQKSLIKYLFLSFFGQRVNYCPADMCTCLSVISSPLILTICLFLVSGNAKQLCVLFLLFWEWSLIRFWSFLVVWFAINICLAKRSNYILCVPP